MIRGHGTTQQPSDALRWLGVKRQRLTVLFTDLCDSSRLARHMEIELYAELLSRVRTIWHEVAEAHDGLVLRTQGDGAVLVFGYHRTSEQDGLRAADAALHIHRRVALLEAETYGGAWPLNAHSGIDAGIVLLGEGNLEIGRFDLVGDVANNASKLEKLAGPGQVLATLHSLGPSFGMFELAPTPFEPVSGFQEGSLVRILGRGAAQRRFDVSMQRGLTPLVGRHGVVQELVAFLAAHDDGPRCAVIAAPAGHGKTRVLEELSRHAEIQDYAVLEGTCETAVHSAVLQPFVQMTRKFGITARSLVHARPAPAADGALSTVHTLCARALASGGAKDIAEFLLALSAEERLLLIVDDWQGSDDASRLLLQTLLAAPGGPRVLLTARPQDDGRPWVADALQITLRTLDAHETAVVVRRWLPHADPFLVSRIQAYAGGVPLFIEELCHSVSTDDLSQMLDGHGPAPKTWIAALVAARLSRLPPESARVLRAASAIGIEAPRWLLEAACEDPAIDRELVILAATDFLYFDAAENVVRFKHGITRDAVYGSIGLQEKRALHGRILEALQAHAGDPARPAHAEALALHSWGAEHWDDAADHWERAADRSAEAFGMDRARKQYRSALEATDRRSERSTEQMLRWCRIANKLGMASIFDPLALGNDVAVFERAVGIAVEHGDATVQARAFYWLGYILYGLGRFLEARGQTRRALAIARDAGDLRLIAQVEATLGQILVATCEYDEAMASLDAAVQRRQEAGGRSGAGIAVGSIYNGSAYTLACKGSLFADRGNFARAHECFDEAMRLVGRAAHPIGNSVRNWVAVSLIWQGRWDEAERVAEESVRIAENSHALLLLAVSRSTLGYARWCRDADSASFGLLRDAVGWMTARGGQMFSSLHCGWLAEASLAEGRVAEARRLSAHVVRRARHAERLGEAVACRVMARQAADEGRWTAAHRWMDRAALSAATRSSLREAALNLLGLGRLLKAEGRSEEAAPLIEDGFARLKALGIGLPTRPHDWASPAAAHQANRA